MRSYRDQIAGKCVHFNGMHQRACRAGVVYADLRKDARLPCISEDLHPPRPGQPPQAHCPRLRWPTEAEIDAHVAESDAALRRWEDAIAAGHCPECSREIEPLRQDGCCVYAACGHRLGQGRIAYYRGRRRTPMPGPPPGYEGDEGYDFDPDPRFDLS